MKAMNEIGTQPLGNGTCNGGVGQHDNERLRLERQWSTRSRISMVSAARELDTMNNDDSLFLLSQNSTFHGVRDFCVSRQICMRCLWGFLISLAVICTIHGCYMIVSEYLQRPVVVSYFVHESGGPMMLPDIVICPFNRFNRSFLAEMNVSAGLAQYLELSYPSPVLHNFQQVTYQHTIRHIDLYEAELEDLLERIGNRTFTEFIRKSVLDCRAFFENPAICDNLTEIMSSAGRCFRVTGALQEGDGFGFGSRIVMRLPHHLYNPGVNQMFNDGIAVKLAEHDRGIDHDLTFIPSGFVRELFNEGNKHIIENCKSKCKPPCSYWHYEKSVSYAHFPSEQARYFVQNDSEWDALRHTIILDVFYTTLDYTVIKHILSMTPSSFVAQIGGQISLWIGGSLISILQLLIYILRWLYFTIQRRINENKNQQRKKHCVTTTRNNNKSTMVKTNKRRRMSNTPPSSEDPC